MKLFQIKLNNKGKGFTLVEIMVAISVFSVVMVMSSGSILSIFDANQKSKTLRSVMDNLNITLESMTRTIRFGTHYHCGGDPILTDPHDCGGGGSDTMTVTAVDDSLVTYSVVNQTIIRTVDGSSYPLTSPDVKITTLAFRVYGSGKPGNPDFDYNQPQAIIVVKGYVGTKASSKSTFSLETTVSQREFDF